MRCGWPVWFRKPGFTDGIAGQRLPFIAVLCRIDNHAVRVYLWVLSARCIVVKAGNNQIPGQDRFRNAISLYPCGGKGLHLVKSDCHRAIMSIDKTLIAAQHSQHRYTFRCREGQVVTGPVLIHAILYPGQVAAIR